MPTDEPARMCHLVILVTAAMLLASPVGAAANKPLPEWVTQLIAGQPPRSRTVVEEATYMGKRVFEVLPGDRAPDSGNEHVLRSEDGRVICEFGGFAGQVASGSCDMDKIMFVRTLYPDGLR